MTTKKLTKRVLEKAILDCVLFARKDGRLEVSMGSVVLDETDGYENGHTLGTAATLLANIRDAEIAAREAAR